MFGRSGVTYLAREREIMAHTRSRKAHRRFPTSLMTAGVLLALLAGAIAIRLVPGDDRTGIFLQAAGHHARA